MTLFFYQSPRQLPRLGCPRCKSNMSSFTMSVSTAGLTEPYIPNPGLGLFNVEVVKISVRRSSGSPVYVGHMYLNPSHFVSSQLFFGLNIQIRFLLPGRQ